MKTFDDFEFDSPYGRVYMRCVRSANACGEPASVAHRRTPVTAADVFDARGKLLCWASMSYVSNPVDNRKEAEQWLLHFMAMRYNLSAGGTQT